MGMTHYLNGLRGDVQGVTFAPQHREDVMEIVRKGPRIQTMYMCTVHAGDYAIAAPGNRATNCRSQGYLNVIYGEAPEHMPKDKITKYRLGDREFNYWSILVWSENYIEEPIELEKSLIAKTNVDLIHDDFDVYRYIQFDSVEAIGLAGERYDRNQVDDFVKWTLKHMTALGLECDIELTSTQINGDEVETKAFSAKQFAPMRNFIFRSYDQYLNVGTDFVIKSHKQIGDKAPATSLGPLLTVVKNESDADVSLNQANGEVFLKLNTELNPQAKSAKALYMPGIPIQIKDKDEHLVTYKLIK